MNLIFANPEFLFLYLFVFLGFYISQIRPNRGGRLLLPISIWDGDRFKIHQKWFSFLIFFSAFSFWVSIFLLVFAAAGPEKVIKEKIYANQGKDIIIILDESPSMFARDLGESRFEVAKKQILNFINLRENDSIGLVTYSSEAVLRVPPTLDYDTLKMQIEELEYRDNRLGDGTDIGMALAFGCYHLKHCTGSDKIIILITDGVNNSGVILPLDAARQAKKMGIRVYPVGIGSMKDKSSVVFEDRDGTLLQGEIVGRRDDRLLKSIADITGGVFDSSTTISVLEEVLKNISSLEPSNAEGRIDRTKKSVVAFVTWMAFIFLCLFFFLRKIILREIL